MKKALLLLLFCTFIFSFNAQPRYELLDAAHWRVIYQVEMQTRKNGQPFTVTDTMALDIGQTWSVYYSLFRVHKDSLDRVRRNELPGSLNFRGRQHERELQARLRFGDEPIFTQCDRRNGETALIFKNRLTNEILTIDEAPQMTPQCDNLFRFTEHIPPQDWTIVGDTLTVLGYLSYKATTSFRGRNYTAWFTPDIPINEGPFKFYGLPGLILKITSSDGVFSFRAIGLETLQNELIKINPYKQGLHRDGRQWQHRRRFVDGDLQQWQAHRKQRFGEINVVFVDRMSAEEIQRGRELGSICRSEFRLTFFRTDNPIEFVEVEIIE